MSDHPDVLQLDTAVAELAATSQRDAAAAALGAAMAAGVSAADAARVAMRHGLAVEAARCWQRAVADDPVDAVARDELSAVLEILGAPPEPHVPSPLPAQATARGDAAPSTADDGSPASSDNNSRGADRTGPSGNHDDPEAHSARPDDADVLRFLDTFEGRSGVYARMWHHAERGTGYSPVRAPMTPDVVRAHLDGTVTVGAYVVGEDQRVRFAVLDVDAAKPELERALGDAAALQRLRDDVRATTDRAMACLREHGLDPVLVDSGYKGRHLWLLLPRPTPASDALAFLRATVAALGALPETVHIDVFPRQAAVPADGLGNLVKLPLGTHRRSGRVAALLDDDHAPLTDPWARLDGARRIDLPAPPTPVSAASPSAAPALPTRRPEAHSRWTEASFDVHREVSAVLRGCHVLRAVVEGVVEDGLLPPDGPIVLNHTLGHLAAGPDAVNYLYDRLPAVGDGARMGNPHRGQVMGCRNVRARLRALVDGGVPCRCDFPPRAGDYPHPLRHLDDLPDAPPPPDLDDLLATWSGLQRRQRALTDEIATMRARLVAALRALPDRAWGVADGTWRLGGDIDGDAVIVWEPGGATGDPSGGGA